MRAREFLKENVVQSDLDVISQITTDHPEVSKKINTALAALVSFLKLKTGQNKSISEDQQTDSLIDELEALLPGITDPILRTQIEQKIKQIKDSAEAAEKTATAQGFQTGIALGNNPDKAIEHLNTEINNRLKKLSQIPQAVRSAVSKEAFDTIRQTKDSKAVLSFLDACSQPTKPIDLENIITSGGTGQLVSSDDPYFEIIRHLAKINPGSGNAASGQGEWMLVLAGTNTKKITPGDIQVGSFKVEVKASDTKEGKRSLTDFVLNSQKLPVEQSRNHLIDAVNRILGKPALKHGSATKGGISALNSKTLERLNPLFSEMNKIKPNSVQETFKEMWRIIMPESDLAPYIDNIAKEINPDGTIDLQKMYGPTATLAAAYYKLSNQHDALLLLNIPTLSYTVVNDPKEMSDLLKKDASTLTMSSIFDFRNNPGSITFKKTASNLK